MKTLTSLVRACASLFALLMTLVCGPAFAGNNATFVSQSVTSSMVTNGSYTVVVTMKNTGTTTWTAADHYALGSENPHDGLTWGLKRVNLPTSILPGSVATFTFSITAPSAPGQYNFQWGMVQDDVGWFGPLTRNVVVTVKVNDAELVATDVPAVMTQGQRYPVSVTMKNTGTTTWPAGSTYRLASVNPQNNVLWGLNRVTLGRPIAPGQQYVFAFKVTAPVPGNYSMRWQLVQEKVQWFGSISDSPVMVNGTGSTSPGVPTISVARTPATMTAGQPFTLTWSSTNATSLSRVCTASGGGYSVNDTPALNGSANGMASAAWVGYPSRCIWSARGIGGTVTASETMTTNAAAPEAAVVTYIHTDGLGSPVARTDPNGNLISRTRYEPYGLTPSGETPTIGFTGHVNDADTGLVYMQQRYYDPVAGRFLSVDPVITSSSTGSNFNRYAYANNSPYNYIDPDGRFSDDDCKGMGGNCSSYGTARDSHPEKNIGDHYGEYLKSGAAYGDGPSTVAAGYDDWALGKGYMTQEQWNERAIARGSGAVIGMSAVATGYAVEAAFVGQLATAEARTLYLSRVDQIVTTATTRLKNGEAAESVARDAVKARNLLKLEIRELGPWAAARLADLRNIVAYGNRAGPTAEQLVQKYGSWENVINAVQRTNQYVNKLMK